MTAESGKADTALAQGSFQNTGPVQRPRSRGRRSRPMNTSVEDIVAVEVRLADGQRRYFLTWGRIQDPVDPRPLAEAVLRNSSAFALDGVPVSASVLHDLRAAATAPHFLECFFQMCQRPIPFGTGYDRWREHVRRSRSKAGLSGTWVTRTPNRATCLTRRSANTQGSFLNTGPGERSPASQPESAPSAYDNGLASLHTTRQRDRSRTAHRGVPGPSDRSKRATWERDRVPHSRAPHNKLRWRAMRSVHQLTLDGPLNRPALTLKTLRRSISSRCGAC